jgi:uncharacterized membrane protein YgcG
MTPPDGYAHALDAYGRRRPARPVARSDAKRLVAERLAARQRRVTVIRRRVVAIAITVFLALWTVIFAQLVSGHDPALTRSAAAKTVAVKSSSATGSGASGSGTTGSSASGSGTSSSGSSSSNQASAVTTSQS